MSSITLLMQLIAACSDSASQPTVESDAESWKLDTVAVQLVGDDDSKTGQLLHRVGSAFLDEVGHLVIANRGTGTVRRFTVDGTFLGEFGGIGGGANEFAALLFAWPAENLVGAYDAMRNRVTYWTSAGNLVRDVTLAADRQPIEFVPLPKGEFAAAFRRYSESPQYDGMVRVDSVDIVLFDATGVHRKHIAAVPHQVTISVSLPVNDRLMTTSQPFSPGMVILSEPAGVLLGFGDRPLLHRHAPDGASTGQLNLPLVRTAVTDAMRRWFANDRAAKADPAERASVRRFMGQLPFPDSLPYFDRVLRAPNGNLWVRRIVDPRDSRRIWNIINQRGHPVGTLTVSERIDILTTYDSSVVAVYRSEDDVERVGLFRVIR